MSTTNQKTPRYWAIAMVAALGLGLSACGGGSDGVPQATHDEVTETVTELRTQIAALQARLGIEDGADPGHDVADLEQKINMLEQQIKNAEEEETRQTDAATGKALFAALAGAAADTNALANVTASTLTAAGLGLTVADDAGTLTGTVTVPTLKAGDSAGSLGGWAGTNYAHTNTGTKVVNAAVVYTNKGPGRSRSFKDLGYVVQSADDATGPHFKDYISLTTDTSDAGAATLQRIGGDAFAHSGTTTHSYTAAAGKFEVRGTYDGAAGLYRCTGTCTSTNDGKGSPSALTGTWHFKPDAGASAMAHQPDTAYLYYGYWVSKDKDGMPTAASAFVGQVGNVDATAAAPTTDTTLAGSALTGSATYAGHAAGKFALDYSKNKVLDGVSNGGHFTADAELKATFGTGATAGVMGMIDNFRLNDGTEDPGWSVELHQTLWGSAAAGVIPAPVDVAATTNVDESMGTTWSMGGTSAPRSGTWSGMMHDEKPGNAPAGDGNTVPTTVTGTFYSEFDSVGRMVGAFGATRKPTEE